MIMHTKPTRISAKLCSAAEAVALIPDRATVACSGFVGIGHPEALTVALEQRHLAGNGPQALTLIYAAGQGDGADRGLNHLAHAGLLKRVIGGHWGLAPKLGRLALTNQIEAYNLPQGVVCQLFRDIAAGRPGCITHVGLDTSVDPIHGGGRLNACTTADIVERVELGGRTWLWYHAHAVDVALIRAAAADIHGNLIMDDEATIGDVLAIAQAARNSRGIVLAQVRRLLDGPADPHAVRVPGILVDRVVVAAPEHHHQTFAEIANRTYYEAAPALHTATVPQPFAWDERRVIAERACDELPDGAIANIGIGIPEGIARVAARRGWLDRITLTVESGPIGGAPAGGLSFGAATHPLAIIDQAAQFDFYDGRGLDFAALGAAEIDGEGNVNVSHVGDRLAGVGGFINISQTARRLVFCCSFNAGGLDIATGDGRLRIIKEGRAAKFVPHVRHLSFSAARARRIGQEVLYVTERAVFRLAAHGLELIETTPGIDVETQILALLPFKPAISPLLKSMPSSAFQESP